MIIEASYLGNTVMPVVMDAYEGAALDGMYVHDKETLLEALYEYTLNPEVARYVTTMSDEEVKDFLDTFIRVSHRIAQDVFPLPPEPPVIGTSPVYHAETQLMPMGFMLSEIGFYIYDPETGEYRDYREGDTLKHGDYRVLRYNDPTYGTVPIIQQLTGIEGVESWSDPMAVSYTPKDEPEQLIVPPAPEDIGTLFEQTLPLAALGPKEMGKPYPGYEVPETVFEETYPIFTKPEYPGPPLGAPAPEVAEALGVEEAPALTAPVEYAMTPGGLTYRRYPSEEPVELPPEIAELEVGEPIPAGIPEAPELPPSPLEWAVQQVFPPPAPVTEIGIETPTPVPPGEAPPPEEIPEFVPPEEAAAPDVYVPEPVTLPPSLRYEPPKIPGVREAPSPPPPPPPGSRFYEPPTEPPPLPGGLLRIQPGAEDPYAEVAPAAPPPAAPPPPVMRIQPGAEPGGEMWEDIPPAPLSGISPTEAAPYTEMPPSELQFIEPPVSTPMEAPVPEDEIEVQGSLEEIMRKADNTEQPALRPTKNVEFGTGTKVETMQGKVVKNRGGGSYSIPEGSSGEIIQDIFGDGTRFRIRIDDGGVADYNRGEISKSATVSELLQEVEKLASHGADTGDVVFHLLRRRASNEAIQAVLDNAEQLGIL